MSSASIRHATTVCVAVGAVALGVGAESIAYAGSDVRLWGPDLAVGWGLVALGLAGWRVAADSRCGPLLCAAGYAWFAGNFASADVAAVSWLGSHCAYLHRALLAHAIVGFPRGRLRTPLQLGVVALAYFAELWARLATSDAATIAVGAAVLVAVTIGSRRAAPAAVAYAVALGVPAVDRALLAPFREGRPEFYEAGLLVAGSLLVAALWQRASAASVADRVVELGETTVLREALRHVLADRSLEVGFRQADGYVDEQGRPLGPPRRGRRVTVLDLAGDAVLVHSPSTKIDRNLADAISRALRLTIENARLHAEAYEQLVELRASRRRVVLARGRQRAVLARRLSDGAEPHLARIDATLAGIDRAGPGVAQAVDRARRRVAEARSTIEALVEGLLPPALACDGLTGALRALAGGSPVAVSLTVEERRFDAAIEHACYLVCSEALANVAKHSHASEVELGLLTRDGSLRLEIVDNGRGGASRRGHGLDGLTKRVEELGGELDLESPPGRGTRLVVEIPLRPEENGSDGRNREQVARTPAGVERRP